MVSAVSAVDGDSKHSAGSFPVSVPQLLLIKGNYHRGSFNSKLNMETLSLLSRHIPICLPNERANPASCSGLWWGMAMHAQGMTDSQRVTAPTIDHVHRVGVTTRRLTTPDASRSGKEGWKAPCVGFCCECLHTFWFQAGRILWCLWPGQTQEELNSLKFKNKPKLFGTFPEDLCCVWGRRRTWFIFDQTWRLRSRNTQTEAGNSMKGTHPLIGS